MTNPLHQQTTEYNDANQNLNSQFPEFKRGSPILNPKWSDGIEAREGRCKPTNDLEMPACEWAFEPLPRYWHDVPRSGCGFPCSPIDGGATIDHFGEMNCLLPASGASGCRLASLPAEEGALEAKNGLTEASRSRRVRGL